MSALFVGRPGFHTFGTVRWTSASVDDPSDSTSSSVCVRHSGWSGTMVLGKEGMGFDGQLTT